MVYALIQLSNYDDVALTRHAKIKNEEFSVNKNFDIVKKNKNKKKQNVHREKMDMIQTYNWYIIS